MISTNVNRAEKYFSDCLRDAIVRGGDTAHREVAYLGLAKHCDLFAEIAGQRCYLEVKLLFHVLGEQVARSQPSTTPGSSGIVHVATRVSLGRTRPRKAGDLSPGPPGPSGYPGCLISRCPI